MLNRVKVTHILLRRYGILETFGHRTMGVRFVRKVGQIGTEWDKSGIFEDYFSHFVSLRQNVLKKTFRSLRFVPFGANLAD